MVKKIDPDLNTKMWRVTTLSFSLSLSLLEDCIHTRDATGLDATTWELSLSHTYKLDKHKVIKNWGFLIGEGEKNLWNARIVA